MDSMQSVSCGLSEEFGLADGRRGQVATFVFGHTHEPRTGFYGATFVLFTWFRHGHRKGCWSIVCSEQMAFPAPDLGGWPQVPCGWLGNVQPGWDQHSLRDVNKVYMWVLCRQSEVHFSYTISIPMCPERLINELCVLSHRKPMFSRAKAN